MVRDLASAVAHYSPALPARARAAYVAHMLDWCYGIGYEDTVKVLQARIEHLHDAICGRSCGPAAPDAGQVVAVHAQRTCTLPHGKPARWTL